MANNIPPINNGTKKWYQSVTIGAALTLIVATLASFGIEVSRDELVNILALSDTLYQTALNLVLSALVIYGRIRATKEIR